MRWRICGRSRQTRGDWRSGRWRRRGRSTTTRRARWTRSTPPPCDRRMSRVRWARPSSRSPPPPRPRWRFAPSWRYPCVNRRRRSRNSSPKPNGARRIARWWRGSAWETFGRTLRRWWCRGNTRARRWRRKSPRWKREGSSRRRRTPSFAPRVGGWSSSARGGGGGDGGGDGGGVRAIGSGVVEGEGAPPAPGTPPEGRSPRASGES